MKNYYYYILWYTCLFFRVYITSCRDTCQSQWGSFTVRCKLWCWSVLRTTLVNDNNLLWRNCRKKREKVIHEVLKSFRYIFFDKWTAVCTHLSHEYVWFLWARMRMLLPLNSQVLKYLWVKSKRAWLYLKIFKILRNFEGMLLFFHTYSFQ